MPDLRNRRQYEEQLRQALAGILAAQGERVQRDPATAPWQQFVDEIAAGIVPTLAAVHAEAAGQLATHTGIPIATEESQRWAEGYAGALALEIVTSTRDRLIAAAEQRDADKLATALLLIFGDERALSIAVTEVTRTITAGEGAVVRRYETETGRRVPQLWKTEGDGKVCQICGRLEGQPEEVYSLVSPGGPPAHPRCRCWLEYAFGEIRRAA